MVFLFYSCETPKALFLHLKITARMPTNPLKKGFGTPKHERFFVRFTKLSLKYPMMAESELGRRLSHFKFFLCKFAIKMEYQQFLSASMLPTEFVVFYAQIRAKLNVFEICSVKSWAILNSASQAQGGLSRISYPMM